MDNNLQFFEQKDEKEICGNCKMDINLLTGHDGRFRR